MVRVIKTACVGKVGIYRTQFSCTGIHHFYKIFQRTTDMLCKTIGNFIGGIQ